MSKTLMEVLEPVMGQFAEINLEQESQEPECGHENLFETTEFGDEVRSWLCHDCGMVMIRNFGEPDPTEDEGESEPAFTEEDIEDIVLLFDHPAIRFKIYEIVAEAIRYSSDIRKEVKAISHG